MTTTEPTPAAEPQPLTTLEAVTCHRCGGTGKMPYSVYGGICFKCNGRKIIYTKRGAAAAAYLTQLRSKPAGELKQLDVIKVGLITMGGQPYDGWATVMEIRPWSLERDGGPLGEVTGEHLTIVTDKVTMIAWPATKAVRVAQSAEQKKATFAAALAYQATLTKAGTPRKTKGAR